MKKLINRNYFWAEVFVEHLTAGGVKHVCISPGSRNTSLTLAFAANKKFKKFVNVDERTNGFFALGLANKLNKPVVLVTTSGTATAELYPAIIEAYQRRIPLIVCTADRPEELQNCGANQTINQKNIYKNHIRKYFEIGLPSVKKIDLLKLKSITRSAVQISSVLDRGPVHLNFPLRKPFEPGNFTDEIDINLYKYVFNTVTNRNLTTNIKQGKLPEEIINISKKSSEGLILCGQDNFDNNFFRSCIKMSKILNYPIAADGVSGLRFKKFTNKLILSNTSLALKTNAKKLFSEAKVIIQFGGSFTSNEFFEFMKESKAIKFLVNEYGDYRDPTRTVKKVIKMNPGKFCENIIELNKAFRNSKTKGGWVKKIFWMEDFIENKKLEFLSKQNLKFEGKIISEVLNLLPSNSNLMISNSMPVRDLEFFTSRASKNINIFSNRGASGIDGIISTAAGIAVNSNRPTVLITGDLAFYHDMNGLLLLKNHKIPLIIILIDNNGGGIFNMLPISKYEKFFTNFFRTPLEIDLLKFAGAYGGNTYKINTPEEFKKYLSLSIKRKSFSVLQIKTNSNKSAESRKRFWNSISTQISGLTNVS